MEEQEPYHRMRRMTLSEYRSRRHLSYKTCLKHFKNKTLESVVKYETEDIGNSVRHYVIVEDKNFDIILKLKEIKEELTYLINNLK